MNRKEREQLALFIDYSVRNMEEFIDLLKFMRITVDSPEERDAIKASITIMKDRIKKLKKVETVKEAKKLLRTKKALELSKSLNLQQPKGGYHSEIL